MRIRIFTPSLELPFAGHPVLGTAFVLGGPLQLDELRLETGAGIDPCGSSATARGSSSAGCDSRRSPSSRTTGRTSCSPCSVWTSRASRRALSPGAGPCPGRAWLARRGGGATAHVTALLELNPYGTCCFARDGEIWKARVFVPAHGVGRTPRPARPPGRSRSISHVTVASALATRSRSARAWSSGGRRRCTPSPARRRRSRSAARPSSSPAESSGSEARRRHGRLLRR